MFSHRRWIAFKISIAAFAILSLSACTTMVEHLVPKASIDEKQYDVQADIELDYAGNHVSARRYFEYYLYRNFSNSGKETSRELVMTRSAIIKLSETDAAWIKLESAPVWTVKFISILRLQPDAQGRMRCNNVTDFPRDMNPKLSLVRVPSKPGGYPYTDQGTHSSIHDVAECETQLKNGAADEIIRPS